MYSRAATSKQCLPASVPVKLFLHCKYDTLFKVQEFVLELKHFEQTVKSTIHCTECISLDDNVELMVCVTCNLACHTYCLIVSNDDVIL